MAQQAKQQRGSQDPGQLVDPLSHQQSKITFILLSIPQSCSANPAKWSRCKYKITLADKAPEKPVSKETYVTLFNSTFPELEYGTYF